MDLNPLSRTVTARSNDHNQRRVPAAPVGRVRRAGRIGRLTAPWLPGLWARLRWRLAIFWRFLSGVADYMLALLGVPAAGLPRTQGIVAWTGPSD